MEQKNSKWDITFFGNSSRIIVEPGEYSICSVYSTSESGIAGRAGISGIMSADLDGLCTSVPE